MKYNLTLHTKEGAPYKLTLGGQLTIQSSVALQNELLKYASQMAVLRLDVKGVEEMDLSFIQLVAALSKYQDEQQKPFYLQMDLNPVHDGYMQLTGMQQVFTKNSL